jgi:hypothetical protein
VRPPKLLGMWLALSGCTGEGARPDCELGVRIAAVGHDGEAPTGERAVIRILPNHQLSLRIVDRTGATIRQDDDFLGVQFRTMIMWDQQSRLWVSSSDWGVMYFTPSQSPCEAFLGWSSVGAWTACNADLAAAPVELRDFREHRCLNRDASGG